MDLSLINDLGKAEAEDALTRCCGAGNWVEQMLALRPFASPEELFENADRIWNSLSDPDFKEAFSHHPKIGDLETLKKKFAGSKWEAGEQASVAEAEQTVLEELARLNHEYENKFGYIFIVCATGKSATEMLDILKSRIGNNGEAEIKIAAEEQRKITRIRLEKLCR